MSRNQHSEHNISHISLYGSEHDSFQMDRALSSKCEALPRARGLGWSWAAAGLVQDIEYRSAPTDARKSDDGRRDTCDLAAKESIVLSWTPWVETAGRRDRSGRREKTWRALPQLRTKRKHMD